MPPVCAASSMPALRYELARTLVLFHHATPIRDAGRSFEAPLHIPRFSERSPLSGEDIRGSLRQINLVCALGSQQGDARVCEAGEIKGCLR